MTHHHTVLSPAVIRRVLAPVLLVVSLLVLAVVPPGTPSADGAAPVDVELDATQHGTLFHETFASGTRHWSTSGAARMSVVEKGRADTSAASLRATKRGVVRARAAVEAGSRANARHVGVVWVRAPRRTVPTTLVLSEVDRSSGRVLARRSTTVRGATQWKRAKVALVSRSNGSRITVTIRTARRQGAPVLVDDVTLRRTAPAATSAPAPRPSERGGFPDRSNTGVPAGVSLSAYTGPMTISQAGTVIDGKRISGQMSIRAKNVVIRNSEVIGRVDVSSAGSLTMTDSFIDAGRSEQGGISMYNYTLKRVEIVNGRLSAHCGGNCHVEDSLLHQQYMLPGSSWHGDGFVTNGGDNMTLIHNTLACDSPSTSTGACSAALAAYGDFAPVTNLTAENNLFVDSPAGFCLYAGYDTVKPYGRGAKNVRIVNNTFERGANGKCGVYGAATFVAPEGSNGNTFSGNVWDDGKPVRR